MEGNEGMWKVRDPEGVGRVEVWLGAHPGGRFPWNSKEKYYTPPTPQPRRYKHIATIILPHNPCTVPHTWNLHKTLPDPDVTTFQTLTT